MEKVIDRFNIRVYGLLVYDGYVLISDEVILGQRISKFPGGGLEFGEGPKECLMREVEEELGMEALQVQHFYTTDFFQRSAFKGGDQIISIYYTFSVADPTSIEVGQENRRPNNAGEVFQWLELKSATGQEVTLPIDRIVLGMLVG